MTERYQKSNLLQRVIPLIEKSFSSRSNVLKYTKDIDRYIDSNNSVLNHNTPSYKLIYNMNDIYDILGVTEQDLIDLIKQIKTSSGLAKNAVAKNPQYILMTILLFYAKDKKDKSLTDHTLAYFTCIIYSFLFHKYYKFEPNDSIMQYTINRLSNKYYFKQYGSVFKAICAIAEQNDKTVGKDLMKKTDENIFKYIISLYSRLNNMMRSFSLEFYKDQKSKKYLSQSIDSSSSDDSIFSDPESVSYTAKNISQKCINTFSQSAINAQLVRTASGIAKVNSRSIEQILSDIKSSDIESVYQILIALISAYIVDGNSISSIGSTAFIGKSISLFNKNNSKDRHSNFIKNELNKLLSKYSDQYTQTEREATKSAYRKAVYIYFVLLVSSVV